MTCNTQSVSQSVTLPQENNVACQQMCKEALQWSSIVTGEDHDCCIFGDITQLLPYGTLNQQRGYSARLEASKQVQCAGLGHCWMHNCACPTGKLPLFSVGGLPCPDMSTCGKRMKRAGPTADVYISHGRWITENDVPLVLIECTPEHWCRLVNSFDIGFQRLPNI